jgi:hypothetical protein
MHWISRRRRHSLAIFDAFFCPANVYTPKRRSRHQVFAGTYQLALTGDSATMRRLFAQAALKLCPPK